MEYYETLLYSVAFLAVITGTVTDLKKREVPDWVSFSLAGFAILARFIYSLFHGFSLLWDGLLGMAIFAVIAYTMFYTGQWGGGDSKLLIGLGAVFGFKIQALELAFQSLSVSFLANTLILGAAYGIIYIVALYFMNMRSSKTAFIKLKATKQFKLYRISAFVIAVVIAALYLISVFALGLIYLQSLMVGLMVGLVIVLSILSPYAWAIVKAVEEATMYKWVSPLKLVEGDWIAKNVYVSRKKVAGPKDLGVTKEQIKKLKKFYRQKKVKKVLVKEGIPFVPAFLLSFTTTLVFGNLFLFLF